MNDARTETFTIEHSLPGERLDKFLSTRYAAVSRGAIQKLIEDGHITLNGNAIKPTHAPRAGDVVAVHFPEARPPVTQPEEIPLNVLYEDEDLLVLNKAPGIVVHPTVGHEGHTLVNALLHHCKGALSGIRGVAQPGIVHRLDKDTSGCLVVAKNDFTHERLATQFAGREVTKIYLALATGKFRQASGIIEGAIGRHPIHRKKMTVLTGERGRAARTDYRVLRNVAAGALVECTLHTGRTHQIRVHLKHLGHPLVGDEVYGRRAGFHRQMLHAWKLGFTHPASGERVNFTAPIPADFVVAGVPGDLA